MKEKSGTGLCDENLVWVDMNDPNRGRYDPKRVGKRHPDDTELRPVTTEADIAATLALIDKQKRRRTRKVG